MPFESILERYRDAAIAFLVCVGSASDAEIDAYAAARARFIAELDAAASLPPFSSEAVQLAAEIEGAERQIVAAARERMEAMTQSAASSRTVLGSLRGYAQPAPCGGSIVDNRA